MRRILLTLGLAAVTCSLANAQTVTTWAGTGKPGSVGTHPSKLLAPLDSPGVLARDSKGVTYVGCYSGYFRTGYIVAFDATASNSYYIRGGSPTTGGFKDAAGTSSAVGEIRGMVVDQNTTRGKDSVFFCDYENNAIRKMPGYSVAARVKTICGGPTGLASNVTGESGYVEGDASVALFANPSGIALDKSGNLIVADAGNNVIRKVTRGGVASLVAGYPQGTPGTKDGDAIGGSNQGTFNTPIDVWVDPSTDDIYVLEKGWNIRKVSGGKITTYAKNYFDVSKFVGGDPNHFTKMGNDYFITIGCFVIKVNVTGTTVTTTQIAGQHPSKFGPDPDSCGFKDGGAPRSLFYNPMGIVAYTAGTHLLVGDMANYRIREIDLTYTGINETSITTDMESGFGFYPNPATDKLTIHNLLHKTGNAVVTFFDLTGREVAKQNLNLDGNAAQVSLAAMNGGAYIVRIHDGENTYTNRLIINK